MIAYGAVVAAWALIAVAFHDPLYDPIALLVSVSMLVGTIAFFHWEPASGKQSYRFLGFVVCAQTFLTSGLSVIQPIDAQVLRFVPTSDAFSFAVEATGVFTAAFLVGALITSPRAGDRVSPRLSSDAGPVPMVALALAGITFLLAIQGARAAAQDVESVSKLGSLPFVVFNPGFLVPLFTAALLLTRKRAALAALSIVIAGSAIVTFLNSSLGAVLVPVRDVLLTYVFMRRKLPRWLLVGGAAAILILNPAKHVFRERLASEDAGLSAGSTDQAFSYWSDAIEDTWLTPTHSRGGGEDKLRVTASRLDANWISAQIYTMVPDRLPFEEGGTYEDIPMVLVPRVLYPDKPSSTTYFRSRWTVKLGLQTWESALRTSVAIATPAESYWNFGWAGVVFVPMLLGAAVGALLRLAPRDAVARAAYIVFAAGLLGAYQDMLVWIVPQCVTVAVAAVLVRIYSVVGRGHLVRKLA